MSDDFGFRERMYGKKKYKPPTKPATYIHILRRLGGGVKESFINIIVEYVCKQNIRIRTLSAKKKKNTISYD